MLSQDAGSSEELLRLRDLLLPEGLMHTKANEQSLRSVTQVAAGATTQEAQMPKPASNGRQFRVLVFMKGHCAQR